MATKKKTKKLSLNHCLLVDDDEAWFNLLKLFVDAPKLIYCSSAEKALEILSRDGIRLVITDTNMPGMTGIDLTREIRKNPRWDNLPVIVLFSGLVDSKITKEEILQMGATLVLTKDEFLPQIAKLITQFSR